MCKSIFLLNFCASSGVRVVSSAVARVAAVSSVYAATRGLDFFSSIQEMDHSFSTLPGAMIEEGEDGREVFGRISLTHSSQIYVAKSPCIEADAELQASAHSFSNLTKRDMLFWSNTSIGNTIAWYGPGSHLYFCDGS